jgi:hypothetical protein
VKHLAQSLSLLSIEGPMKGVRMLRAWSKCFREPLLVEGVYGVAHRLGVAAQRAGDLVGILASVADEQDLTTAEGEGLEGERTPASKVSRSASLKGRTKIGRLILWRITINYCPVWRGTREGGGLEALDAACRAV